MSQEQPRTEEFKICLSGGSLGKRLAMMSIQVKPA
jgi:hypothetical protein